ncbi:MAG TPA: endonuclease/exonuclease/phosphatase family protein [Flavobacteriales bacterium]|nr:endonuclease/exonuclease/phosphatase family protein [Flavobacteriales bacterium]HIA05222.1 endonuclease/exonuclease/phosphatase family protein [Flavobacteriales bacterium]
MFKTLEKIFAVCLLPAVGLLCFAPEYWMLSLVKAFAIQILAAIVLITFIWLLRRKFRFALLGLCSILTISSMMPPLINMEPGNIQTNAGLRIAHFNVLKYNENYLATIKAAKDTNADFISFQEVNKSWQEALTDELAEEYPYFFALPQEACCYGIAVFSKHRLSDVEEFYSGSLPNIRGDMSINGTKVHFVTSHTPSPTSPQRHTQRNQHIQQVASHLDNITGPKVAIGDFNSVPWDSAITEFKEATLLKDSRKTLTPTYPASLKIAQIPLDYIFHSEELTCLGFTSIEGTSSDHLGILGTYRLNH